MTLITRDIRLFGISIRGPRHIIENQQNQDSWFGIAAKYGSLIVVCDGLGSQINSHLGSRAACKSVRQAIKLWTSSEDRNVDNLLKLTKLLWEINITPEPAQNCATTCLFAVLLPTNQLILAGLGDGLGVIRNPDGQVDKVMSRSTGFSNRTLSLGAFHRLSDWTVKVLDEFPQNGAVMLASDGIADDLIDDQLGEFINWLDKEFSDKPNVLRRRALYKEFSHWPTPGHQDDKTLAIIIRKG